VRTTPPSRSAREVDHAFEIRYIFAVRSGASFVALLAAACTDEPTTTETRTGLRLTVEFESTLDIQAIDVFGTFGGGAPLGRSSHDVPLSLDPPGLRQVEIILEIEAGALTVRADGRDARGVVRGSGAANATIVEGELAPVRVVLGAPVICGDGAVAGGVEQCDDGNTTSGDGCSATCGLEACMGAACPGCGNGRLEAGEGCDDGNTGSGDGCSATCTVEIIDVPRVYEVEQLEAQTTTSAAFVQIPGARLVFTPSFASEAWLLFASGRLRSDDPSEISAEVRLTIDGVEADLAGHQTQGVTDNWAGFVFFDRIGGDTSPHAIALEHRSAIGTTEVDDLRIVAMLVPPGADLHYVEIDDIEEMAATRTDLGSLTLSPATPGDYVVLAKLSHSEAPGGDTVRSWLEDSGGDPHPNDPNGSRYSNPRSPWAPIFTAFRAAISEPRTFTLRGTSSANGDTTGWWDPAYGHRVSVEVTSSGTVTPEGYAVFVDVDHETWVAEGRSLFDGSDVRVVYQGTERDRVLDAESTWGAPDTRLWFTAAQALGIGESATYQIYFGNPFPDPPLEGAVFDLFDDFDFLDTAAWAVESGNPTTSNGELIVGPQAALRRLSRYDANHIFEVRSRLSDPIANRMTWFALISPNIFDTISWYTDGSDHHAQSGGEVTHFMADTPTSDHVWSFARESEVAVHFWQDGAPIAVHQQGVPIGAMLPGISNETQAEDIIVDWVRIRPWVSPEPTAAVVSADSLGGGLPSQWCYRKIAAFRAEAFHAVEYAESLAPETTTSTTFQIKASLDVPAPPAPTDDIVIQAERVSGGSNAMARRMGELRAAGVPLMVTSHKINRTSLPLDGYHHVAGLVDLRRTDAAVFYENGYASPEAITVRAAESVIIVLRLPPK
jgi:cysteine-rich repeat protein